MINAFSPRETDFSTNGVMILDPWCMKAEISEKLNNEYQLTIELAVNEYTTRITNEMVIRCPAPVRFTPALDIYKAQPTEVWRVNIEGYRLNLRTGPSLETGKVLRAYRKGTEVIVTDKSDSTWYAVVTPDGLSGYMWAGYLAYVRTEQGEPAQEGTVEERETRDQLFRISSLTSTLDCIQIEANHISYDLRRNYLKSAAVKGKSGAQALVEVLSGATTPHDFTGHSDVAGTLSEDIARTSPIAAILSDGGLIAQAGGELLRDNFDFYWTEHIGRDRGVTVAYRNNMAGMDVTVDTSDLITRIIPIGYNKKNEPIYGEPVDSSHIGEYAQPYVAEIEYKDVKIGSGYKDEAAVRTELARLARLEYDKGIDLPTVSATVDYVDLEKTDVGKNFPAFTGVFMGDTIRIRHEDYGLDYATEIVAYTWDCLRQRYIDIELGSRQAGLSDIRISPAQLGVVPGRKLAAGTVSGVELGEGSVTNEHVSAEGIAAGKIYDLDLASVRFVEAEIHRLVAGEITTDQLYADLATLAVAQITTANIERANINWAQISSLTSEIASIANASIGSAKIDYAKIFDLVTDTAIITEGVGGQLYINRLAVTDANVVSLTAGALMLKAGDGSFVRLVADGQGGVTTETVTVEGDNIAAETIPGGKLIENTITARELNVSSIFADQALVRAIKAANIDVSNLFAAQATIDELDSYIVNASTIQALQGELDVWAADKINLAVSGIKVGAVNMLKGTQDWSGATLHSGATVSGTYENCSILSNSYTPGGSPSYIDLARWTGLTFPGGGTVTVSFWAKGSGTIRVQVTNSGMISSAETSKGGSLYGSYGETDVPISSSWERIWIRWTVNDGTWTDKQLLFRQITYASDVQLAGVQMENGTLATDWSPSPEDTEDAIDQLSASLSLVPGEITAAVSGVVIGGRNLLRGSNEVRTNSNYYFGSYVLTQAPAAGDAFCLRIWGSLGPDRANFAIYNSGGNGNTDYLGAPTDNGDGTYTLHGKWKVGTGNTDLRIYVPPVAGTGATTVNRIKLELGDKFTDWTPAPEDASIPLSGMDNLYSTGDSVSGYLTNAGGIAGGGTSLTETTSDYIAVTPGETLTFQCWVTPDAGASNYLWMAYGFFDSSKAWMSSPGRTAETQGANTGTFQHRTITFTVPAGAAYIRISGRMYANGKMKLERNPEATAYQDAVAEIVNNSITINKKGVFIYSTGTFQLDAENPNQDAHINIRGLLTADNEGGLTAEMGSFAKSLSLGGKAVLTKGDLAVPVVVSTSQPAGHGLLWIKPSSVTSARYSAYSADSRNNTVRFGAANPLTFSFAAETSNTLANSTFTYTLEFDAISLSDATLTGVKFSAKATKSSASVSFAQSGAITMTKWQVVHVTLTASSNTNLCANASAISVAITAAASNLSALYIQSQQYMTLTVASSAGGSVQACNVNYIP